MNMQSVISVYGNMPQAEDAVRALDKGGFPIEHISVVAQDLQSEKEVHGYITAGDVAKGGASTGAWVGGLFGLLVAGPLAAMLLGGIEGALAGAAGGGLLGALVGWGVSEKHILKYEEHLKGGKYLVIAHGTNDQVMRAREILNQTDVEEVNVHAAATTEPVAS
jgi:uncharacterized membrane protein